MKKGICILLTAVLLFAMCCMPLGAAAAEPETSPREILASLILQADSMLANDDFIMTDPERQTLTQALASAKEVYDNPAATENDLTLASAQLIDAIESPLCRSAIYQSRILCINLVDLASFAMTPEELQAMRVVIGLCDELLARETLTMLDTQQLLADIQDIMESAESSVLTKEQLHTLIQKAQAYMDRTFYTSESYALFETAYQQALLVYESDTATQEDIDAAFSNLLLAIISLVPRPVPTIYGDVTGDKEITVSDVLLLQKKIARVEEFSAAQEQYGDVNGDQTVNTADVLLVQKHIAHIIDRFPAEDPDNIGDTDIDDVAAA